MLDAAAMAARCARSWEVIRVVKKIITWAVVIFVVYYLATNPHGAADFVRNAFTWLRGAGSSMATFVNSI
jgi:hypothetical protein